MCLGVRLLVFTQLGFIKLLRFVNKYFSSNFKSFQSLFFQKMFIVCLSYYCRTLNPHKLIHLLLYHVSMSLCSILFNLLSLLILNHLYYSALKVTKSFLCHLKFAVQFSCSVMSDSLQPHESQHARPPCPSPTPGVHSDSRPLSQ